MNYPRPWLGAWFSRSGVDPLPLLAQVGPHFGGVPKHPKHYFPDRPLCAYVHAGGSLEEVRAILGPGTWVIVGVDEANLRMPAQLAYDKLLPLAAAASDLWAFPGDVAGPAWGYIHQLAELDQRRAGGPLLGGFGANLVDDRFLPFWPPAGVILRRRLDALKDIVSSSGHPARRLLVVSILNPHPARWYERIRACALRSQVQAAQEWCRLHPLWQLGLCWWRLQAPFDKPGDGLFRPDGRPTASVMALRPYVT